MPGASRTRGGGWERPFQSSHTTDMSSGGETSGGTGQT